MTLLIQELANADKWLNDEYKDSKYYREYLDRVNDALKDDSHSVKLTKGDVMLS